VQKPKTSALKAGLIKVGTFGPLANAATKVTKLKPEGLLKTSSKKQPKLSEKKMETLTRGTNRIKQD